jgi:hypothetical protein
MRFADPLVGRPARSPMSATGRRLSPASGSACGTARTRACCFASAGGKPRSWIALMVGRLAMGYCLVVLAAWYERPGPAVEVLQVGEMPDPAPGAGEVRVRVAFSGVNPGDTKKRADWLGYGMPFPRVVPTATARASSTPSATAWTWVASVSACGLQRAVVSLVQHRRTTDRGARRAGRAAAGGCQ